MREAEKRGIALPKFKDFNGFEKCSGEEYYDFVRLSSIAGIPENVRRKAGGYASRNPQVREYLRQKIFNSPNLVETTVRRGLLFQAL